MFKIFNSALLFYWFVLRQMGLDRVEMHVAKEWYSEV
jgi:hypothetical protein